MDVEDVGEGGAVLTASWKGGCATAAILLMLSFVVLLFWWCSWVQI